MRPARRLLAFFAGWLPACMGLAAETLPVSSFEADLPTEKQPLSVALLFENMASLHGAPAGNLTLTLRFADGAWTCPSDGVMADWRYGQKAAATVKETGLSLAGGALKGRLAVALAAPSKKAKTDEDVFEIDLSCRVHEGRHTPHLPDPLPSIPPWKKSWRPFGGTLVTGEYTATLRREDSEPAARKGQIIGGINPIPVPGAWGVSGNGVIERAAGGGMRFLARLSPKRVMPPEQAFAELWFAAAQDWSGCDGLRLTVVAPARRDDAAIAVRIKEASGAAGMTETSQTSGAWYGVTSAALLRETELVFDVPFSDFCGQGDASCVLDLNRIVAVAVGVDNPMGVGDVEFVIKRLELYRAPGQARPSDRNDVAVSVEPTRRLSMSGYDRIPDGMFGVHSAMAAVWWMKHGDLKPDARAYLRQIRPGFCRAASGYPGDVHIEAVRPSGIPLNAMGCHHLWTWSRPQVFDEALEGRLDAFLAGFRKTYEGFAAEARFAGLKPDERPSMEVSNESFMWGRYANAGPLLPAGKKDFQDPTQHGYLSGRRVSELYTQMFLAAWEGANGNGKRLRLAGPCSSEFHNDDFSHFRDYVAPFIDRCIGKIDILTEHHYSGSPLAPAASWEVAKTYCMIKHGIRIPIANTETTDIVWSAGLRGWYNLSDILECLRVCPDVAHARAIHALWGNYMGNAGETAVLMLLNKLRGLRVPVSVSDDKLRAVASWNEDRELVLVVFNPTADARRLRLSLPGPHALRELLRLRLAASAASPVTDVIEDIKLYPLYDAAECKLERLALPAGLAGDGTLAFDLPATSALRWVWTCADQNAGPAETVTVRQGFWKNLFVRVKAGESAAGPTLWEGPAPAGRRAFLRVITRDVHRGEGKALVNGHEVELPWSSSNDGRPVVQDISIPAGWLAEDAQLAFECAAGERANGFTVHAASVLVETISEAKR